MYPEHNQMDPNNPNLEESSAYPANPDSEYGWEKLFSERLYMAYSRNFGIKVAVARYHNIYGPLGTWDGGREKAPAAICRKVARLPEGGGEIEVWGDGNQTRSFLYIDDCIEATRRLMASDLSGPFNATAPRPVSNKDFSQQLAERFGKKAPFAVPAFILRLAFGEMADLLLFGQNVQPKRLLDNGFEFHYPQLKEALNALQF